MDPKDPTATVAEAPPVIENDSPVLFEFTNETAKGVRLHQDGKVTFNGYEPDEVSKELIVTLLPHFALLQQLRQVVDAAVKSDLKGVIHLITGDDKNLDAVEMTREHIFQANRQITIRERGIAAAAQAKAAK